MGEKQYRRRQRVLLFPSACLIFCILMTGCRSAPPPLGEDLAAQADRQETQLLNRAEACLQKRDYAGALRYVDRAMSCCSGHFSHRTLRILQTVLAAPENSMGDQSRAIRCFKGLNASSPESVAGPASRCWVAALDELLADRAEIRKLKKNIQTLKKQIEELKAVDLETETSEPDGQIP
jgi:hypothetical protein